MKKSLKILMLIHPDLNPLDQGLTKAKHVDHPAKTEAHIYSTLKTLGHSPEFLSLDDNLDPLMDRLRRGKVDLAFNLLEELKGEAKFDFHAVSYLESRGIKFTGSGPRALILSRDKTLAKLMVAQLGVPVPRGMTIRSFEDVDRVEDSLFPAFVKFNTEDASLGLGPANRVTSKTELRRVCKKMFSLTKAALLVEEFIPGYDLSIAVLGNQQVQVFPPRKLSTPDPNWVAGEGVKFDSKLRARHSIQSREKIWISPAERRAFEKQAITIYRELGLRGYARIDFRVDEKGMFYFLEANANPDLSKDEDFGLSAKAAGLSYPQLISKIVTLSCRGGKN